MVASITDSFVVPPKMVLYNKNTPIALVADDPNMNFKNFPEKVFFIAILKASNMFKRTLSRQCCDIFLLFPKIKTEFKNAFLITT